MKRPIRPVPEVRSQRPHRVARAVREDGSVMVLALFFAILTAGIVLTGTLLQRAHQQDLQTDFRRNSQALQFARAGMTETINWFRRQTVQPVLAFAPVLDPAASPRILDTEDPEIGLVRQFRIGGRVHGRYEVWKRWDADPDPTRRAWRASCQVEDMGRARGTGVDGGAWRVTSIGYVFELNDPGLPFDQHPNRVLATRMMQSEFLRRSLAPPGQAALSIASGVDAAVNLNGRVEGGPSAAGIFYPAATGTPSGGSRVTGSPALAPAPVVECTAEAVFGVSVEELRGSANAVVTDPRDFPPEVPENHTVFAELPSLTFDRDRPLRGTGLVYVRGDVTLAPGSNSVFNGLLFVEGSLTIHAPALIEGAVICTGSFSIQGAGDYATVRYSDGVLNALRREVGQYRFLGSYRNLHGAR